MGIRVRVLQANHGDCILVTHDGPEGAFNLLIDGGNASTFKYGPQGRMKGELCKVLDELKAQGQQLDLVILTHIDDDHIGGLLRAFKAPGYLDQMVKSIWFNSSRLITKHFDVPEIPENDIYVNDASPDTSVRQGKEFEKLLDEIGCERAPIIMAGQTIVKGPFTLNILSPNQKQLRKLLRVWPEEKASPDTSANDTDYSLTLEEFWAGDIFESDTSVANGSSIAFLLQADKHAMLFLGDAHDSTVVDSLSRLGYSEQKKLKLDLLKVSHHGSEYNTSSKFLGMVCSDRYIISTNGSKHGLPNKRTVARILAATEGRICFNYKKVAGWVLLPDEKVKYFKRLDVVSQIEL
ncbi:MBL fold metallo-hydrolase [Pseudomonas versuta]|uniref:MBL fold metallo-hydrolase n=1 Tax=Pseudomonas versuta TaxID=1788301 RepID=A0A854A5I7_9PSED|nr:MBL fold metallo-hydrolase [Pseudomonas versuta]OKA24032.1 MBL fold metallo-hydrolase [Pseudomonas versuta]